MEKRAITQPVNPVLPEVGFIAERLLAPQQAMVAFFSRVCLTPPGTETVKLEDASGRVLAAAVVADDDYPNAPRSLMDGFAIAARCAPGRLKIVGDIAMGVAPHTALTGDCAMRIPTGGVLPAGADAVVPIEDVRVEDERVCIDEAVQMGANVAQKGADMRKGEALLEGRRRISAAEIGVLATVGATEVTVYRRPRIAVLSSGDELVAPSQQPRPGQIRDSNRYAVATSLRAMGAQPRHYPTMRDEADEFERTLASALPECDGVVLTGGSSVGERDRLPDAVARIADPGVIVHGLRVKPGKPTLFGAHGGKPIVGLPGNPASALFILEAVAAPIVAALTGAPVEASTVAARLAAPVASRAGWTWYIPVALKHDAGLPLAHPLAMRSFSVSLAARADGFIIMSERDDAWPAGAPVTVFRFLGGC
ncbi:MAG TPA: gephyrin-like molybdotransferase Glp [Candidatus Cybelea sp.]|jgi:putative molybdopterin biosynthesis protein